MKKVSCYFVLRADRCNSTKLDAHSISYSLFSVFFFIDLKATELTRLETIQPKLAL